MAILVALLLVSCFAERRGLSRDALLKTLDEPAHATKVPTLDEINALRVPAPPGPLVADKPAGTSAIDKRAHACLFASVKRDYDAMLLACGAFLDAAPGDARAVPAVRQLVRASVAVPAASKLVVDQGAKWLEGCARAKQTSCADLAYVVNDERIARATLVRDGSAFAAAMASSGRLTQARVEGPFAGDALMLLDQDRERRIAPSPLVPHHHVVTVSAIDGRFAPAERGVDGLHRIELTASAPANTRATLYLTSANAARVRVDGLIVAERIPEDDPPAVVRAAIDLQAGQHTIEILALALGASDRIGVTILDSAGRPALREGAPMPQGSRPVLHGTLQGAVEELARAVQTDRGRDELLWFHALARAPSFGVSPEDGRRLVRDMVAHHGTSPMALAVAAEALGDDPSVPERISSSTAAAMWQRVRTVWPDHPVARIAEARDLKEERPDEALRAYRALVKEQPRYPFGHRELIDILLEDGVYDEARASADALIALGDGDTSPENINAAIPALRATADHVRASQLEAKQAAIDADWGGVRLARHLIDAGQVDVALASLERATTLDPSGPALDAWIDLVALRDPNRALEIAERHAARFPSDEALQLRRVRLLWRVRGADAARATLVADVLPRMRDSAAAHAIAEELGVKPSWLPRLALGDQVIAERRALKTEPFPGYAAVALLDDVERNFHDDDSSTVVRHLIIELKSKEILDRFGEIGVGSARLVRLRVAKPDGSIVEPDRHGNVDDVSLPDLALGDIVELLTVESDVGPAFHGSFETRSLDGTPTPALLRRYLVTFPRGFDATPTHRGTHVVSANGAPAPARDDYVDDEGKQRTRLSWVQAQAPAQTPEPFSPGANETARIAGFAWGVDAQLWALLRGTRIERATRGTGGAWIEAAANVIARGPSPEEKLEQIFTFVVQRIEPADAPDDARHVLATGRGQRTPLFIALARAAGLDADPVALHLATQPPAALREGDVPDANAFSIIAARVRLADGPHFALVDGNAVLDQLPPVAKGAQVLDVSRAATRDVAGTRSAKSQRKQLIEPLPETAIDKRSVRVQVELAPDSKDATVLAGVVVVTIPAGKADAARRGVRRATQDQLRQTLERSLVESLPGIQVESVKIPAIDDAGRALTIGARVRVPLATADGGDGTTRFEHLFAEGASGGLGLTTPIAAYIQVPDRKSPLLVIADAELLEVQIGLPKGGAFVEAPESTDLRVGPFHMEQRVEITDGVLFWRRTFEQDNARIPPSEWPATYAGLANVAALADARLSFVVGATSGRRSDLVGERAPPSQNR